jgi:hypothetical protein
MALLRGRLPSVGLKKPIDDFPLWQPARNVGRSAYAVDIRVYLLHVHLLIKETEENLQIDSHPTIQLA